MHLNSKYVDEPNLVFGHQREEKDPRIGLKYHGPYHYSDEAGPSPTQVRIGIVSDANTTTLTKNLIEAFKNSIPSASVNKWLYPDFPGINLNTPIKCEFIVSDNWNAMLRESEIEKITAIGDANERIAAAVNLYRDAVEKIASQDDLPHVIVCSLPPDVEERCGISKWTRGAKSVEFSDLEQIAAELLRRVSPCSMSGVLVLRRGAFQNRPT